jgi:ABC-type transporter Mla subunit MlaD
MTQKANFFKLGLFTILAFGLGAAFLIVFGAGEFLKKDLLAETCFNESVQGLSIGSEVKYKGIKIGSIKSITSAARVYQTKSDYVLVVLSLENDTSLGQTGKSARIRVENAIRDGLTISLAFKGLTGAAYLETDYSAKDMDAPLDIPWTPKNIYIPSRKSNMKQLGDALNQILDNLTVINLKGITSGIETLLKTLEQKAGAVDTREISGLAASLLTELKDTNHKVNTVIGSDRVAGVLEDVRASFAALRTITETSKDPLKRAINDFQQTAGSTREMAARLETGLSPKIEGLSVHLDQLMESLAATSRLLENMVWMNSDKIQRIMENLETTTENLKQMSKDLKRYPGRLLFEKPPENIHMEKQD